jgi:hypothetical protein
LPGGVALYGVALEGSGANCHPVTGECATKFCVPYRYSFEGVSEMKCRVMLPALLVAGLYFAGTQAQAFDLLGTLRGGDGWVQKGAEQKGHVQKGHVQKGHVQKVHDPKGCEQKAPVQKGCAQKGCEQKAIGPKHHVQRPALFTRMHVQKADPKGVAPCVQKGPVQKAPIQKAPVQKGCVQKGCDQKAAPVLHRNWIPRMSIQKAAPCGKDCVQKGCVQKGCEQKAPVQKGSVQKGCEQKAPVQKHCAQKGHVQKA